MSPEPSDMDVSTIYMLISNPIRKSAILELGSGRTSKEVSTQELARLVAKNWDESVDDCYRALYHRHLPTLEKAQAIEWDEESDRVRRNEYTVMLSEYLQEVEGGSP